MTTFPFPPDTVDRRLPGPAVRPHDDSHAGACTMVVHLGPGHSTTGLLKVLSVLHSRRVAVTHVQYVQCPDRSAVMIVECSPATASLETVRKSVARAIPVVSVSVHTSPTRDGVRRPRARRGR
ncbi:hypothetical protein [Micromonospora chalcea]|uniref:hypothetical protein n=1 Tax=Micromonospora chalcea TaxID=1874 RepID=UPI000D48C5C4|nr:hypothetical protein [Micromonospora chalcea]PPA57869.1 hypothetical protein BAW75_22610 [Micromonospora chalcea]